MKQFLLFGALVLLFWSPVCAQNTFQSVQDGNWNDASTWTLGTGLGGTEGVDFPSANDIVTVDHYVIIDAVNNGTNFSFSGDLTINVGDTLESQVGNNINGFVLEGNGIMRNFGSFFTLDVTEEPDAFAHIPYEFVCQDNAIFIGGLNSFTFISDDWELRGNAQVFIDNLLCYAVSDDVNITSTSSRMYGTGNIRIGGDGLASTVEFSNGASAAQIDDDITIWRNTATTDCSGTALVTGTNTDGIPPFAFDDSFSTALNTAQNQAVLYQGTDDLSPITGDTITLTSAGSNTGASNGSTSQGGTVSVNNNGTAANLTDDYIVYTPPNGFLGVDTYNYLITNEGGETDTAAVTVTVAACGSGFLEDTTLVSISSQSNNAGVDDPDSLLGAPDAGFAEWYTGGDVVHVDFGKSFSAGTQYRVTWRVRSGLTNAQPVIRESTTNGSFTALNTVYTIANNTTETTIITSENDFQFLQIEKVNAVNGTDFEIDAIQVLDVDCLLDSDGDGIANTSDIDDDNDGILDVDECTDTPLAFANSTNTSTGDISASLSLGVNTRGPYTGPDGTQFNVRITTSTETGSPTVGDGATGAGSADGYTGLTISGERVVIEFLEDGTSNPYGLAGFDFMVSDFENNNSFLENLPFFSYTSIEGDTVTFGSGTWTGWEGQNGIAFGTVGSELTTNGDGDLISTYAGSGGLQADKFARLNVPSVFISRIEIAQHNTAGSSIFGWANATFNVLCDVDGDGVDNQLDLDSDNDGIADIIEAGGADGDSDGRVDNAADTDGDGWDNVFDADDGGTALANPDTDGDGITDQSDIDADGDGIIDLIESQASGTPIIPVGSDSDGDGVDDNFDTNNGQALTTPLNTDGTDNPDYTDTDADNDGALDALEAYDTNNNGTANTTAAGADTDSDGLDDNFDNVVGPNATTNVTNSGQSSSSFPNLDETTTTERDWREVDDFESDGVGDFTDIDDDNDGIPDAFECGTTPFTIASSTNTATGALSGNLSTGVNSAGPFTGPDGSQFDVRITISTENASPTVGNGATTSSTVDGYTGFVIGGERAIIEFFETGTTTPYGLSGFDFRMSDFEFNNGFLEDIPDFTYQTIDGVTVSYGSGFWTGWEGQNGIAFGEVGSELSTNGDGDLITTYVGAGGLQNDKFARLNIPNTFISRIEFAQHNTSGSAVFGWANSGIGITCDTDNDGLLNQFDLDSDNDGIADIIEAGGVDADGNGVVDGTFTDTDGDGWSDIFDSDDGGTALANSDTDVDGYTNAIDIDSDNDGIVDVVESQASGSINTPSGSDADGDGIDDSFDPDSGNSLTTPVNTDGTDNPDYTDTDSDNDADLDALEAYDTDNDGTANTVAAGTDSDRDGLDDNFDNVVGPNSSTNITNSGQTSSTFPNLDNTGTTERDWREIDDFDQDGIANNIDIDDDNDGILDTDENGCVEDLLFTSDQAGGTNASMNAVLSAGASASNVTIVASGGMILNSRTTSDNSLIIQERPSTAGATLTMIFSQPVDEVALTFESVNVPQIGNFTLSYDGGGQTTNAVPVLEETPIAGSGDTDLLSVGTSGGVNFVERAFTNSDQASGRVTFANNDNVTAISFEYLGNISGSTIVIRVTPSGKLSADSDNDGQPNQFDLDSDNDGIADIIEAGGVDADGNGIVDGSFTDGDDDGWSNTFDGDDGGVALTNPDTDGDGFANHSDIDADGDGIVDVIESQATGSITTASGTDSDGDGIDDNFDTDSGNSLTTPVNTDGTDNPDYTDTDSDNDGDLDLLEAYDTDNDGFANTIASGSDSDGDGLDDNFDNVVGPNSSTNTTNSGQTASSFPNLDESGTAERDWREAADADQDGIVDNEDIDDDNDGILDVDESNCVENLSYSSDQTGGTNATSTGQLVGNLQTANVTITGSGDMITDSRTTANNSISIRESPAAGGETLTLSFDEPVSELTLSFSSVNSPQIGNFTIDYQDGSQSTNVAPVITETPISGSSDTDELIAGNSGGTNFFEPANSTSDQASGTITFANNNNITSISFEYLGSTSDGTLNINLAINGKLDADTDNDGILNQFDLDSDNDGIPDIIEAGGVDTDNDGVVDGAFTDTDGDGWSNTFDGDNGGSALSEPDTDGDGFKNYIDLDSDDDGIVDLVEAGGTDSDGDGRADTSTDGDGDGWSNTFDSDNGGAALSPADTDGDGFDNYLDLDSDSDGIIDNIEGQTTLSHETPLGTDTDSDGWDDRYDSDDGGTAFSPANTDLAGDGADYIEQNSDNDALPDWIEAFDDDGDGDALNDLELRADNYETAAGNPGVYVSSTDSDADGIADFLEDADGDDIANFLDPDNATFYRDTDNDGLIDLYDADNFGSASNTPAALSDADGDNNPDFRDTDNSITLPIQLVSFQAEKVGDAVQLSWTTVTEINNDYFTIERSLDGVVFEPIITEQGAGTSAATIDYKRLDRDPQVGNNYYRLSQTDFDGNRESFNTEVVYFSPEESQHAITLYPNPGNGDAVYVQFDRLPKGAYQLDVLSAHGQMMSTQTIQIVQDNQWTGAEVLNGRILAGGVYYLRITSKNQGTFEVQTLQFVVQ